MTGRRLALTAGIATAIALGAAAPATATFPGRNGEIVLVQEMGARYANQKMSLLRFAARLGRPAEHPLCAIQPFAVPLRCERLGPPAFAPDGRALALVANEAADYYRAEWAVWLLTPYGERTRSIPVAKEYRVMGWAPDASELLVAGPEGVAVLGLDGAERRLVAAGASEADWCADGRIVVAQRGRLHVIAPDGASRRLTRRGAGEPSCAPGARRVAFARRGAIWTVPLSDSRRARRLTAGHSPTWSPDGRQIAYLSEHGTRSGVVTHLTRIGLRRLRVRRVSAAPVYLQDSYSDVWVHDPDWRPR